MTTRIYLDNNASTPLAPEVIQTLQEVLYGSVCNPSSPHHEGQVARGKLDQARRSIAAYFQVKPQEVLFTSSGTEAMNFLIQNALKTCKGEIISSESEHSCVYQILKERPNVRLIKGAPTLDSVKALATDETSLVVLMAVNNETGIKTPLHEIATWAQGRAIPLIVDGVAWLGKEKVVLPPGVSGIGFSGHKIHAPTGIGCAIWRSPLKVEPLIIGGAQERGLRGGTENMLGILAMAKAIELLHEPSFAHIETLRNTFEQKLLDALPGITINAADLPRISNVSNVLFSGYDGETLLMKLDQAGLSASLGSACTSGALEPSRALLSLGLSYKEAKSSLRFSFSRLNTLQEVSKAVAIIQSCV